MTVADMKPLTGRSLEILRVISVYITAHGYPPTIREIGGRCGITSSSHVVYHLNKLEKAGYIERDYATTRGIGVLRLIHQE